MIYKTIVVGGTTFTIPASAVNNSAGHKQFLLLVRAGNAVKAFSENIFTYDEDGNDLVGASLTVGVGDAAVTVTATLNEGVVTITGTGAEATLLPYAAPEYVQDRYASGSSKLTIGELNADRRRIDANLAYLDDEIKRVGQKDIVIRRVIYKAVDRATFVAAEGSSGSVSYNDTTNSVEIGDVGTLTLATTTFKATGDDANPRDITEWNSITPELADATTQEVIARVIDIRIERDKVVYTIGAEEESIAEHGITIAELYDKSSPEYAAVKAIFGDEEQIILNSAQSAAASAMAAERDRKAIYDAPNEIEISGAGSVATKNNPQSLNQHNITLTNPTGDDEVELDGTKLKINEALTDVSIIVKGLRLKSGATGGPRFDIRVVRLRAGQQSSQNSNLMAVTRIAKDYTYRIQDLQAGDELVFVQIFSNAAMAAIGYDYDSVELHHAQTEIPVLPEDAADVSKFATGYGKVIADNVLKSKEYANTAAGAATIASTASGEAKAEAEAALEQAEDAEDAAERAEAAAEKAENLANILPTDEICFDPTDVDTDGNVCIPTIRGKDSEVPGPRGAGSTVMPLFATFSLGEHRVSGGSLATSKRTSVRLQSGVSDASIRKVRSNQAGLVRAIADVQYFHGETGETFRTTDAQNRDIDNPSPGTIDFLEKPQDTNTLADDEEIYVLWVEVPDETIDRAAETVASVEARIQAFAPFTRRGKTGAIGEDTQEALDNFVADRTSPYHLSGLYKHADIDLANQAVTTDSSATPLTINLLPATRIQRDGEDVLIKAGREFVTRYGGDITFTLGSNNLTLTSKIRTTHTLHLENGRTISFDHERDISMRESKNQDTTLLLGAFESVSMVDENTTYTDGNGVEHTLKSRGITNALIEQTPVTIKVDLIVTADKASTLAAIKGENLQIWYYQLADGLTIRDGKGDTGAQWTPRYLSLTSDIIGGVATNPGWEKFGTTGFVNGLLTDKDGNDESNKRTFSDEPLTGSNVKAVYQIWVKEDADGSIIEPVQVRGFVQLRGMDGDDGKSVDPSLEARVDALEADDSPRIDPDALHYVEKIPRHISGNEAEITVEDMFSERFTGYTSNLSVNMFFTKEPLDDTNPLFKYIERTFDSDSAFGAGTFTIVESLVDGLELKIQHSVTSNIALQQSLVSLNKLTAEYTWTETQTSSEVTNTASNTKADAPQGSALILNKGEFAIFRYLVRGAQNATIDVDVTLQATGETFFNPIQLSNLVYLEEDTPDGERPYAENIGTPDFNTSDKRYPEGWGRPENAGYLQGTYQWRELAKKGSVVVEEFAASAGVIEASEGHAKGNPEIDAGKIGVNPHGRAMSRFKFDHTGGVNAAFAEIDIKKELYHDTLRDINMKAWFESGGDLVNDADISDTTFFGSYITTNNAVSIASPKADIGTQTTNNGTFLTIDPKVVGNLEVEVDVSFAAQPSATITLAAHSIDSNGNIRNRLVSLRPSIAITPSPTATTGKLLLSIVVASDYIARSEKIVLNVQSNNNLSNLMVTGVDIGLGTAGTSGTHPDDYDPTNATDAITVTVEASDGTTETTVDFSPVEDSEYMMGDTAMLRFKSITSNHDGLRSKLSLGGDLIITPTIGAFHILGPYDHGWDGLDIYKSQADKEAQRQIVELQLEVSANELAIADLSQRLNAGLHPDSDTLHDPTTASPPEQYHLNKKQFVETALASIPMTPGTYKLNTYDYDGDGAVDANESDRAVVDFASRTVDGKEYIGYCEENFDPAITKKLGDIVHSPFDGFVGIYLEVAEDGNSGYINVIMKRGLYDHLERQNVIPDGSGTSLRTDGILFMVLTNVGTSPSATNPKRNSSHEFEIDRYNRVVRNSVEYQRARGHLPTADSVNNWKNLLNTGSNLLNRLTAQFKVYRDNSHPSLGFSKMRWHTDLQNKDYQRIETADDLLKDKLNELIDAFNAAESDNIEKL